MDIYGSWGTREIVNRDLDNKFGRSVLLLVAALLVNTAILYGIENIFEPGLVTEEYELPTAATVGSLVTILIGLDLAYGKK